MIVPVDCGGTILACRDARADGDPDALDPGRGHAYLSTDEPPEQV